MSDQYGRLGGLSFHAASWHEQVRDEFIGWSPRARARNLPLVVNNGRFLILPQVKVHGLVSQALTLATARLVADWRQAYGVAPVLAYTHVAQAHSGQSYRASGWQSKGQTSGRRDARREPKQVFVLPLQAGWQARLQAWPRETYRARVAHALPMMRTGPGGSSGPRAIRMGGWLDVC